MVLSMEWGLKSNPKVVGYSYNICATLALCILQAGHYFVSQGFQMGETDCFSPSVACTVLSSAMNTSQQGVKLLAETYSVSLCWIVQVCGVFSNNTLLLGCRGQPIALINNLQCLEMGLFDSFGQLKKRYSPFLVWGFYLVAFKVYLGH